MKYILLASAIAFSSCGTQHNGGSDDANSNQQVSGPSNLSKVDATSLYVADVSALPVCESAKEGFLAYVKSEAVFKACLDSAWTNVDVKGPAGRDGSSGKDGAIVQAPAAVDKTLWTDPNTGKKFKAFGITQYGPWQDVSNFALVCNASKGYYVATFSEMTTAAQNGIYVAFKDFGTSYDDVWVSYNDPVDGQGYRRFNVIRVAMTGNEVLSTPSQLTNVRAAVVCIAR